MERDVLVSKEAFCPTQLPKISSTAQRSGDLASCNERSGISSHIGVATCKQRRILQQLENGRMTPSAVMTLSDLQHDLLCTISCSSRFFLSTMYLGADDDPHKRPSLFTSQCADITPPE